MRHADFRFMFYNTENYFDTENDTAKWDEEFLPDGQKYWTDYRYHKKKYQLFQVIAALGEWDAPDAIALCEVENRAVLEDLVNETPLQKAGYEIIHHESPDGRGIDVAFLYRPGGMKIINEYPIPVHFPEEMGRATRDILYVKAQVKKDSLHFFVNHWPSRWGGQMETEPKRMFVAGLLRHHVDSILQIHPGAKIIISGDLNDHPYNKSLKETLRAKTELKQINDTLLYNLIAYNTKSGRGTHKYHGEWGILDHIIITGNLLNAENNLVTGPEDAHIFDAEFLLEADEKNTGKRVNRTYIGYKYHGGFSDHLPVYLDLFFKGD